MIVVAALAGSRLGLGMRAIREDEEAAEASGVGALRLKLTALALSTGLAGLAGGLFAFYHISYYPSHPFGPHWTFDALLMTFIGGSAHCTDRFWARCCTWYSRNTWRCAGWTSTC